VLSPTTLSSSPPSSHSKARVAQKQELPIADMFNSCEKQDLRLLAPEIHKFIQKQDMRSTAEIQKQDYLRIAAEIRSLREEIAAALNVRNVGHT
jgi:hypothetical protein